MYFIYKYKILMTTILALRGCEEIGICVHSLPLVNMEVESKKKSLMN